MAIKMKRIVAKSIKLSEEVIISTKHVRSFKNELYEIKCQTGKLAALLRQMVVQTSSEFYERPVRIIIDNTEQVLYRALSLVLKCCSTNGLMKRILTIIPASDFRTVSTQLQSSVGDISWLHGILFSGSDLTGIHLSLPPIAFNDPILSWTWECIGGLYNDSIDVRCEVTAELLSFSLDSDQTKKLIIEEGGVVPLLKLLTEGSTEEQVIAAKTIGTLGFDSESVQRIIDAGVCKVFEKILKEGSVKVQTKVAWAVSNLVANYPSCQVIFAQSNILRLLINHLAFGVVHKHVPNVIVINKATSVLAIVMARNNLNTSDETEEYDVEKPNLSDLDKVSLSSTSFKDDEMETKTHIKEMAARALCNILKGNSNICRSIIDSKALMSFIVLIEEGNHKNVQHHSMMALMEITAVVEEDSDLRRTIFRQSSPVWKIVVDQLVKVVQRDDQDLDLLIPCVKSIGNLARTFRVAQARVIAPMVNLLNDVRESEVWKEALVALAKFACKENNLHHDHSKAIIEAGGVKHLIQLIFFSERTVQRSALVVLCYITLNAPNSEELVQDEVMNVLEWASKQSYVTQDEIFDSLLTGAKAKLEHFQFLRSESMLLMQSR